MLPSCVKVCDAALDSWGWGALYGRCREAQDWGWRRGEEALLAGVGGPGHQSTLHIPPSSARMGPPWNYRDGYLGCKTRKMLRKPGRELREVPRPLL